MRDDECPTLDLACLEREGNGVVCARAITYLITICTFEIPSLVGRGLVRHSFPLFLKYQDTILTNIVMLVRFSFDMSSIGGIFFIFCLSLNAKNPSQVGRCPGHIFRRLALRPSPSRAASASRASLACAAWLASLSSIFSPILTSSAIRFRSTTTRLLLSGGEAWSLS